MSKEGFLIYTGLYNSIREFLSIEQKAMLLDAMHDYHDSGTEPDRHSSIAMVFAIYKNQFRLDASKHLERAERAKINGNKGGRPRKNQDEETQKNPENPVGFLETQTNPEKPRESYKEKEKEKEKEKDKEKVKEHPTDVYTHTREPEFDGQKMAAEFQSVYQKRQGKPRTLERAFAQCLIRMRGEPFKTDLEAFEFLKTRAAQFMAYCTKAGTGTQYVPMPETWLDGDQWKTDWIDAALNYKKEEKGVNNNGSYKTRNPIGDILTGIAGSSDI